MKQEDLYRGLQTCFIHIRYCALADSYEPAVLQNAIEQINVYKQYISDHHLEAKHPLLLYCIDTLFDILAEKGRGKLADFADVIHNMPEIYLGKRDAASFAFEVASFRDKYGANYFTVFDFS